MPCLRDAWNLYIFSFYFRFFNKKDFILKLFCGIGNIPGTIGRVGYLFPSFLLFIYFLAWIWHFQIYKALSCFQSVTPSHLSSFPSVPPSYFPVCMTCRPSYIFLCVWQTVFELLNNGEKCNKALLYHSFPRGKEETWIFTSHRLKSHLEMSMTPCSQQKTGEGLPEGTWRD